MAPFFFVLVWTADQHLDIAAHSPVVGSTSPLYNYMLNEAMVCMCHSVNMVLNYLSLLIHCPLSITVCGERFPTSIECDSAIIFYYVRMEYTKLKNILYNYESN